MFRGILGVALPFILGVCLAAFTFSYLQGCAPIAPSISKQSLNNSGVELDQGELGFKDSSEAHETIIVSEEWRNSEWDQVNHLDFLGSKQVKQFREQGHVFIEAQRPVQVIFFVRSRGKSKNNNGSKIVQDLSATYHCGVKELEKGWMLYHPSRTSLQDRKLLKAYLVEVGFAVDDNDRLKL